jgi:hypothetical protein
MSDTHKSSLNVLGLGRVGANGNLRCLEDQLITSFSSASLSLTSDMTSDG